MVLEQTTAHVVAVLTRAASLFAPPTGAALHGESVPHVGVAAETVQGLEARTREWRGAAADQHREHLADSSDQLSAVADTDDKLCAVVDSSTQTHAAGHSAARGLLGGAQDIPAQLQTWGDLPAGPMTALQALRAQLAGMQQLMADHQAHTAQAAAQVQALQYQVGR
jgi:hypothetical protein